MKKIYTFSILLILGFGFSCSNNETYEHNASKTPYDLSNAIILSNKMGDKIDINAIHICTEHLPPPPPELNILLDTDTFYYYRDEEGSDTFISNSFKIDESNQSAYLASLTAYRWPENYRDIKVMFLDGDTITHRRVKETAKQWENYCGIRFLFGNYENPDITISFEYSGSWSAVGTYSRRKRPSMNLGWLFHDTPQDEYNRVVLHEFGHAIGFIHEHQSPSGNIKWNREMVYQYYMKSPNHWDKTKVDQNIFYKYSFDQVNSTAFDSKSIMIYAIPAILTLDNFSVSANSELSEIDKNAAATIYPQRK